MVQRILGTTGVQFSSLGFLVTLIDSTWTPLISGHSARLMSVLAFESEVLAWDIAISSALIAFPVWWALIGDMVPWDWIGTLGVSFCKATFLLELAFRCFFSLRLRLSLEILSLRGWKVAIWPVETNWKAWHRWFRSPQGV